MNQFSQFDISDVFNEINDPLFIIDEEEVIFFNKFFIENFLPISDNWMDFFKDDELLKELDDNDAQTALIMADHIMPNKNGITFLSDLVEMDSLSHVRKVLITGQASHSDTIDAINNAAIDYYVSKPWVVENLHDVARKMITLWVLDSGLNYHDFDPFIDTKVLFQRLKKDAGTKH